MSDEFQALSARVRNWGRWGDDDQVGTLNLITPEVVANAAAAVRHGRTIPLGVPLQQNGVQAGFVPGRDNPTHTMHAINQAMDPEADADAFHTSDDHITMTASATCPTRATCTTATTLPLSPPMERCFVGSTTYAVWYLAEFCWT